jgi:hypothetical protein
VGRDCQGNGDCVSDVCSNSLCVPGPANSACFDLMQDGNETDIDCGGGACPACGAAQICLLDSDCHTSLKCDSTLKKCQ